MEEAITKKYIDRFARLAELNIPAHAQDYRKDGLLHCYKCHTPKEMWIDVEDNRIRVRMLCQCEEEQDRKEKSAWTEGQENRKINDLRVAGLNESMRNWTFANSNGSNAQIMERAVKFVDRFDQMRTEGVGFLFYGDVGTGKSYMAAAIANGLIDKGIPALVTNFSRLLNDLGSFEINHNNYINNLNRYPLLVIDDLGIERSTEFALEKVFDVIDSRYRDGKPLIVTTNLDLNQLSNPMDIGRKRIYDRVLEMCLPLKFSGKNQRVQKQQDKLATAQRLFA